MRKHIWRKKLLALDRGALLKVASILCCAHGLQVDRLHRGALSVNLEHFVELLGVEVASDVWYVARWRCSSGLMLGRW